MVDGREAATTDALGPWRRACPQVLCAIDFKTKDDKHDRGKLDHILDTLADRKPFRVFTVELNGGRRFEVDHPRALVVRDGVAVFIAPGGIPIWFDRESVNQIIDSTANTSV